MQATLCVCVDATPTFKKQQIKNVYTVYTVCTDFEKAKQMYR